MVMGKICELPEGYKPSENEEFMCDCQREYFRRKLEYWKAAILNNNEGILNCLQGEKEYPADVVDRSVSENGLTFELRSEERGKKLVSKIEEALLRIDAGTYGYCVETGVPISLERLEARPVAMLSIEAQKRHEAEERICKDNN